MKIQKIVNNIGCILLLFFIQKSEAQIGVNGNIQTISIGVLEGITDRNISLEYKIAPLKSTAFFVKVGRIVGSTKTFRNDILKEFGNEKLVLYSGIFNTSFNTQLKNSYNINNITNIGAGVTFTSNSTGLSQPLGYYSGVMINAFRGSILTRFENPDPSATIIGQTTLAKQEFLFKYKHTEILWRYGCVQPLYDNFIFDWSIDVGFAFGSMNYDKTYSQAAGSTGQYEQTDYYGSADVPHPTINILSNIKFLKFLESRTINGVNFNTVMMPRIRVGYLF